MIADFSKFNPVIMPVRNCPELTQEALASVAWQTVPHVFTLAIDNDCEESMAHWLTKVCDKVIGFSPQIGVTKAWNIGLLYLFAMGAKHALVINNDIVLPRNFYERLLGLNLPFVTGMAVESMGEIAEWADPKWDPIPHPDFSAYLIRKECWDTVGKFDESMMHYASDCDYHVRAHHLGISLMKSCIPFYHERSSTLKHSSPQEAREIQLQADADREAFREKYGCIPGEPAYNDLFSEMEVTAKRQSEDGSEEPLTAVQP